MDNDTEEFCIYCRRYKLTGYVPTFLLKSAGYYDPMFDEFAKGDDRYWIDDKPFREIL